MSDKEEKFEGFIPTILSQGQQVEMYSPEKFWKENTIDSILADLFKMDEEARKLERKPEYILSAWEAKELPLSHLEWICENYRVLCGLEAHNIVRKREQENK